MVTVTYFWELLFWTSVAWLAYVYAGYPLCLWILSFWRTFGPEIDEEYVPKVSVLISARNEEKDIRWKVSETLAWNYPSDRLELIIASDASDDGTDEILRGIQDPRLKYIRLETRVGKNEALNRLVTIATGDLLFFTDANSHVGPDCLRRLTRYFADPRVGCVTGFEHTIREEKEASIASGWKTFLGIESLITGLESRLGSVLTCDGSIFCIRRELYTPVQPELANDLELPIRIGSQGWALLYEPAAMSMERAVRTAREDFQRRRRVCGQGFLAAWRLRRFLRGVRLWQFISRKLLRWLALIPITALFFSITALVSHVMFAWLWSLQILFYCIALGGWLFASMELNISPLFSMPFYFLLVNIGAFTGVIEACLGRRFCVWEIAKLSRGREEVQRTFS